MAEPRTLAPDEKGKTKNVYHDFAYFDGADHPRCQAAPDKDQAQDLVHVGARGSGLIVDGTWGCALPAGHEDFENPRHHPHAWVRIGG